MSSKTYLITGATGKQGKGVVAALSALVAKGEPITILALTRNPSSDAAQALASQPGVKVIQGDLDEPEAIFTAHGPFDGVFSVQDAFSPNEEQQGKALADLALKYKVGHFVYTGIDFAGVGENDPAPPQFKTKWNIEKHLRQLAAQNPGFAYTILRPTGFYENFYWPLYQDTVLTMWNPAAKYKMIGCDDIGRATAEILHSRSAELNGKAIELAGDALTAEETAQVWKAVTGKELAKDKEPEFPDLVRATIKFNAEHEFVADVAENRRLFPWMTDFKTWLASTPLAEAK